RVRRSRTVRTKVSGGGLTEGGPADHLRDLRVGVHPVELVPPCAQRGQERLVGEPARHPRVALLARDLREVGVGGAHAAELRAEHAGEGLVVELLAEPGAPVPEPRSTSSAQEAVPAGAWRTASISPAKVLCRLYQGTQAPPRSQVWAWEAMVRICAQSSVPPGMPPT